MSRFFSTIIGLSVVAFAAADAEAQYQLIFDPATGSLTIDPGGDPLITYVILGDTGALPGGFVQANHTQIPGNGDTLNLISEDDELSDSNIGIWNGLGPTSIGDVLPIGLSQADFNAFITEATYVAEFGGGFGDPSEKFNFDIVYVPEPTSFVLLAIGGMMLARRRKK